MVLLGEHMYINGFMKQNLDIAKTCIKKDLDMLFLYDGNEGSGKSVKAMQDAYYCDPSICIERITFTPNEFRNGIMNAKQYQAVVYDEAYTGLSSRATMSLINRTIVTMLAEIRQKNLFIFIVMPTFFDLDKYVALWRSRALIHVYMGENFTRGNFAFFNTDKKKDLYINGKKYYNYGCAKANFIGNFTKWYPPNIKEEEYKKKKHKSLMMKESLANEEALKNEVARNMFEQVMSLEEKGIDVTHEVKMKILDLPESTYYWQYKKWKKDKELEVISPKLL